MTRHTTNPTPHTPPSLTVRGLFPSHLVSGQLVQTAFTARQDNDCHLLLDRMTRFEAKLAHVPDLSRQCVAWREKLQVWDVMLNEFAFKRLAK